MRTGLYNRHLATLGGGERYSLSIAAELSRHGPVDVICHTPVSRKAIAERLHLDLDSVRLPRRARTSRRGAYRIDG